MTPTLGLVGPAALAMARGASGAHDQCHDTRGKWAACNRVVAACGGGQRQRVADLLDTCGYPLGTNTSKIFLPANRLADG